jgi:hypothetical protein
MTILKQKAPMIKYDYFNREERAICAHLFRLLHENLGGKAESPFGQFLDILFKSRLAFNDGISDLSKLKFENISIFCEASLIRDAYHNTKPNVNGLMDDLTRIIMVQEKVQDCRLFSQLPEVLRNISKTHPKQIRQKATASSIHLSEGESRVYGAMQGMFNAKPDLVLTVDNMLLVCEAKHTEKFDEDQLNRTWNITEVWAKLLYADLGFSSPPAYSVFKLGAGTFKPHIHWGDISAIADKTYPEHDRTRIAIKAGMDLLIRQKFG